MNRRYVLLLLLLWSPAFSEPDGRKDKKNQSCGRKEHWRRLHRRHKETIRRTYRKHPPDKWYQAHRVRKSPEHPPIERFPSHWRRFLIKRSAWIQKKLEKLPPDKRPGKDLPPGERIEAIKRLVKPEFRNHRKRCKSLTRKVFTRFELTLFREFPPKERLQLLARSRWDPFCLVSPWSWRKFRRLGKQRELVREYLATPEHLAPHKGKGKRTKRGRKRREENDLLPRRKAEGDESKRSFHRKGRPDGDRKRFRSETEKRPHHRRRSFRAHPRPYHRFLREERGEKRHGRRHKRPGKQERKHVSAPGPELRGPPPPPPPEEGKLPPKKQPDKKGPEGGRSGNREPGAGDSPERKEGSEKL